METDLDSILNGTPAEPVAEAPAVEAAPAEQAAEAATERARDEKGRYLPKGEEEAAPAAEPVESAPPAPSDDDSPTVPRKALIDERSKRQSLESQLEEMNRRIASMQPQQPEIQQPQQKPDQWEDPEGHERWILDQAAEMAEQRAVQAFQRQHVIMSAEAAKTKYPDYLDKVAVFERLAAENPALSAQMLNHPNPAEYAYSIAKSHEEVSQYGSLDEWKAAERVKLEAEALEKLKASLPGSSAPPTLSTERSVAPRSGPAWSGPKPLGELLQ
jgi:hypothetical protein